MAVAQQRQPFDVLHGEVRPAVRGNAAVEQMGDVRVDQAGENLPLAQEALEHGFGIHAALDQLDRGALLELTIDTLAQPDLAHSAGVDLAHQQPRADAAAWKAVGIVRGMHRGRRKFIRRQATLEADCGTLRLQHRDHDILEFVVGATQRLKKEFAFLLRRSEKALEYAAGKLPALGVHRQSPGAKRGNGACRLTANDACAFRAESDRVVILSRTRYFALTM